MLLIVGHSLLCLDVILIRAEKGQRNDKYTLIAAAQPFQNMPSESTTAMGAEQLRRFGMGKF